MTGLAQFPAPTAAVPDDLAEGNLFVEVQVPSWPPSISQTVMRHRDARRALTIRAKPSGRLRIELARSGYTSVVVRTVHLRLRAPGLLRLNVMWRGDDVVVAAGGQIIGTSREFSPEGMMAPEMIEETEAPLDHVGNEHARLARRRRAEILLQEIDNEASATARWFATLAGEVQVVTDLIELVRQGRHHHLAGLSDAIARLVTGDAPLLQCCAALVDAPLLIHMPISLAPRTSLAALIVSAFDVTSGRDQHHQLAVDLDVWLRHEHPWVGGQRVPVEALLLAVDAALTPARPDHVDSDIDRAVRATCAQGQSVEALYNLATTMCTLAVSIITAAQADKLSLAPWTSSSDQPKGNATAPYAAVVDQR
jgi:hypothetical protein